MRMSEVLYFLLRRVQAELVQRGALRTAVVPHRTFERRNEAETLGAWPCGLAGRAAMGAAGRVQLCGTPDSYLPARQAID